VALPEDDDSEISDIDMNMMPIDSMNPDNQAEEGTATSSVTQPMHPYFYDPEKGSGAEKMYAKYRTPQNPDAMPELPKMNNQPPERRIPIWNRAEGRKITGNAAPLERNLQRCIRLLHYHETFDSFLFQVPQAAH
jgi:hypothetical protein